MILDIPVTPNLYKQIIINNEKEMEKIFAEMLRKNGWFVEQQKKTDEGNRIDVLARHHSCLDYFVFELKYFTETKAYTKALKQIHDKYYNKKLTYKGINPTLFALITPYSLYHQIERPTFHNSEIITPYEYARVPMIIERFFWRFGFGVGSLEDFSVQFTSQGDDARINLACPNDRYRSLVEKIKLIKQRQH